ncbi:MAG: CarD family transcriptional regulator [Eubacteriales bacterium]|nr:CarD family transcriptional regulator [Eubacteriales bacterium]
MFHVNDWVVYGTSGVYCIVNTDLPDPTGVEKDRRYYELQASKQKCRTYVPMDSSIRMRPVISKEQAHALISHIPDLDTPLCTEQGKNSAEKYYKELLQNSDCETIAGIVHKLTERRNKLLKSGRHMSYTEEKYLRRGRDLLDSEFSVALGIPQEDVASFVRKNMPNK